ncbi:MAG: hypothetical protein HKN27_16095 [Silicimonas sp.]|nr:hypothetical protein [Silicimonas sp.]
MIGLLRWFSRAFLILALGFGLYLALMIAGPPEWMDRARIDLTHAISEAIQADPEAEGRLNAGEALWDVLPQKAQQIEEAGIGYKGGVLILPTGFDTYHYYDVEGACWNFVQPRLSALDKCPR